jgi:hypothetical protein
MTTQDKCPFCGGGQIVRGIRVGKTAEVGDVGLDYQAALIVTGTEPLLADLCGGCGSVTRLWVQQADRKWRIEAK